MVSTSPTKRTYLDINEPQFSLDIKQEAVKNANTQCQIGKTWMDWDDLYSETYGKSSHGYYAQVFRTYQGMQNTLGTMCIKCPKIMQDAWQNVRNHEQNYK